MQRIPTSNDNYFFSFIREESEDKIFSIFNLSNGIKTVTINDSGISGTYVNIFSCDTVSFTSTEEYELPAWGYFIFEKIDTSTGISDLYSELINYKLFQNYPNPIYKSSNIKYSGTTKIKYSLPQNDFVSIILYDLLGKEVKQIISKYQLKGEYEVRFKTNELASGIYYYQMRSGEFVQSKKMLIIK